MKFTPADFVGIVPSTASPGAKRWSTANSFDLAEPEHREFTG